MSLEPKPLEESEHMLDIYSSVFGADREMLALLHHCPVCDATILVCDNGWLDARPGTGDEHYWYVMKLGPMKLMAAGGVADGSRHTLHEHQPEGT